MQSSGWALGRLTEAEGNQLPIYVRGRLTAAKLDEFLADLEAHLKVRGQHGDRITEGELLTLPCAKGTTGRGFVRVCIGALKHVGQLRQESDQGRSLAAIGRRAS